MYPRSKRSHSFFSFFFFFSLSLSLSLSFGKHSCPLQQQHQLAARALRRFFYLFSFPVFFPPRRRPRSPSPPWRQQRQQLPQHRRAAFSAASLDDGLNLDQGSPRQIRKGEALARRSELRLREGRALGPVPSHREDGCEPGEARGVPVRVFEFFGFMKFHSRGRRKVSHASNDEKKKKSSGTSPSRPTRSTASPASRASPGSARSLWAETCCGAWPESRWPRAAWRSSGSRTTRLTSSWVFLTFVFFLPLLPLLSLSRPHTLTQTKLPALSLSLSHQAGAEKLPKLRVLLASNNKITSWSEVERLSHSQHSRTCCSPATRWPRNTGIAALLWSTDSRCCGGCPGSRRSTGWRLGRRRGRRSLRRQKGQKVLSAAAPEIEKKAVSGLAVFDFAL